MLRVWLVSWESSPALWGGSASWAPPSPVGVCTVGLWRLPPSQSQLWIQLAPVLARPHSRGLFLLWSKPPASVWTSVPCRRAAAFDLFWQRQQHPLSFGACFCLLLRWPGFIDRPCGSKDVSTTQPSLFVVVPPAPRQPEFIELQVQAQCRAGISASASPVIGAQNSTNSLSSPSFHHLHCICYGDSILKLLNLRCFIPPLNHVSL